MCWQCEQMAGTGGLMGTIEYIDFSGDAQQVNLGTTSVVRAICPDLLDIDDLGEADTWRGHLIRGLFRAVDVIDAAVDWWTH